MAEINLHVDTSQISYHDLSPEYKATLANSSLGCPTQILVVSIPQHGPAVMILISVIRGCAYLVP